ncbi:FAD-dependent oxidoreductase, partial [Burkholderia multivorans]
MFVQSDRHVASYYAGTYPAPIPRRPALDEHVRADVLVVGAGFSGLHTALRLALAGLRVVVLEASRVAWAASGRNGGQALLGWSCDMPPLEAALGRDG